MNVLEAPAESALLRGEIRLLATLLLVFAAIKIAASSLAYLSAVVSAGGTDSDGSRTLFWLPQVLFYTVLLTSSAKDIRAQAEKLFPQPTTKDKKPLPAISDLVKMKGNVGNGQNRQPV